MEDFFKHTPNYSSSRLNHTPLPSHLHKKHISKKIFFLSLIPFFFACVSILGYIYLSRSFKEDGLTGGTAQKNNGNLTAKNAVSIPTPTPTKGIIPPDWLIKKSSSCEMTISMPPAIEPYVIPRDPNTAPSYLDDEGKFWVYEDIETKFFMFNRLNRAIFKDPEAVGVGYVSAAVEVYCMPNDEGYTAETLEKKLIDNLAENFSVVSITESIDDVVWGYKAKLIKFTGGNFGDNKEQFILFATQKRGYIIRATGATQNRDIIDVRSFILNSLVFN